MADLLNITKQVSQKIGYYEAIVDFTDESHWFNPFYPQPKVMVIWTDELNDENNEYY